MPLSAMPTRNPFVRQPEGTEGRQEGGNDLQATPNHHSIGRMSDPSKRRAVALDPNQGRCLITNSAQDFVQYCHLIPRRTTPRQVRHWRVCQPQL